MSNQDRDQKSPPANSEGFDYLADILGQDWVTSSLDGYSQFREQWSPSGRWHHRRPRTSPIVPLLYWNSRERFDSLDRPMGFWSGHPTEVLERLSRHIRRFEYFWRDLPNDRGTNNLVWALKSPQRAFSLAHELSTATYFGDRSNGEVEPLFLDPSASKGEPDFLVHTTNGRFAVQCKSQDPTKARQLPYDLWQYLAGVFHRLAEDSGRSLHLAMVLKERLSEQHVRQIAARVSRIVGQGILTPYPWRTAEGQFQLFDLDDKSHGNDPPDAMMSPVVQSTPLYMELIRFPAENLSEARRASLFIGGNARDRDDVTDVIRKLVTTSTRTASTSDPLIVAVHLYQDIDFREFPQRPLVQKNLIPWSDKFFSENPQLAMIYVSSNFGVYGLNEVQDNLGIRHARPAWVMESPEWDHADVAALGI